MNVFLLTDIEGIAGVDGIEYIDRDGEKYEIACRELCRSINIATDACFLSGADKVYYLDGHGGGGNVIADAVDPRAKLCSFEEWHELLEAGEIDCVIELGAHARAGTVLGFLDHTITSKAWFSYRINGIEMSEISIQALFFGSYNVPVVACIGDETVCEQTKEYIPGIFNGAVKRALSRNKAETYPNADDILADTVKRALSGYRNVPIYKLDAPYTVELTFYRSDMCEEALERCSFGEVRVDARTIRRVLPQIKAYGDLMF